MSSNELLLLFIYSQKHSILPCSFIFLPPFQPPTVCSLFLFFSIRLPWFPWDWILQQIMLQGSLYRSIRFSSSLQGKWSVGNVMYLAQGLQITWPVPTALRFTSHVQKSSLCWMPERTVLFKCPASSFIGCNFFRTISKLTSLLNLKITCQ